MFLLLEGKKPNRENLNNIQVNAGSQGEENLDIFFVYKGIVSASDIQKSSWTDDKGKYGATLDCLNRGIDRLSEAQVDVLAKDLYTMHIALKGTNAYRWKIEALILSSPALIKAMFRLNMRDFVRDCVIDSRLTWGYRTTIQSTINALRCTGGNNRYSMEAACAEYLEKMQETYATSRQTVTVPTSTQTYRLTVIGDANNGTFNISGFKAETGLNDSIIEIQVNGVKCKLEGRGNNNRQFVYNSQRYELYYSGGWKVKKL